MLLVIATQSARAQRRRRVNAPTVSPEREEFPTIVGQSVKIRDVCRRIGSAREERRHRADPGRERHRQGSDRQRGARAQPPRRAARS